MKHQPASRTIAGAPWMVTVVQAQLDEMAGACNDLHREGREIRFIVPITQPSEVASFERPTSHIAIFSFPIEQPS